MCVVENGPIYASICIWIKVKRCPGFYTHISYFKGCIKENASFWWFFPFPSLFLPLFLSLWGADIFWVSVFFFSCSSQIVDFSENFIKHRFLPFVKAKKSFLCQIALSVTIPDLYWREDRVAIRFRTLYICSHYSHCYCKISNVIGFVF